MGNAIMDNRGNAYKERRFERRMKVKTKKIVINCIAFLIVLIFAVLPFLEDKGRQQYDIVFLGDSVVGNGGEHSAVQVVADELGIPAFNGALGGSAMSVNGEKNWGSVTGNQWCMARLAESMIYKDWQSQKSAMVYANYYNAYNLQMPPYFSERMKALMQVDFDNVKVLVIEHGTNDYNAGRKLDNKEDLYDVSTFGGALRYSLKLLQEAYPDMTIVLVTPIYCEFGENLDEPCYVADFGGGTLEQYVELELQIAQEFGVMCIDAYHSSGIWDENAKAYLIDGVHLLDEGALLLGKYLAGELQGVCK